MIKLNPTTLDAELVLGTTGTFSVAPKIDDERILQDGDHVWFTLRKKIGGPVLLQKDITDFENGIATIPIPPSDTENMEPGSYIYDLRLLRTDGNDDSLLPKGDSAYFVLKRGVK